MKPSLFLHYGPGATAEVEKEWLSRQLPELLFWNQPKVKTSTQPLAELVSACQQQARSMGQDVHLVGHSFGNNLIAAMLDKQNFHINKAILISPLLSISKGIHRLAAVLLERQRTKGLCVALDRAKMKNEPESFWNLIGQIGSHPNYSESFWHKPEIFSRFQSLVAKGAAFDGAEWQVVMNEYFYKSGPTDWQCFKQLPILAIFGEHDPYFDSHQDLAFWQKLLGPEQVIVMKDCGHFPHLEHETGFVKIFNEWFN